MVERRHVLFAVGAAVIGLAGAGWSGLRRMGSMESYAADLAPLRAALPADPDPQHWVLTGQACQRFALQATAMGLKHAFLNQPVEVPDLRYELAMLVGLSGRRPDLVMRFGRGAALPFSARRPFERILL